MKKISVKLVGTDGNVFSIIGRVSSALKKVGQTKEAEAFVKAAFAAKSYNEVLCLAMDYVDVK